MWCTHSLPFCYISIRFVSYSLLELVQHRHSEREIERETDRQTDRDRQAERERGRERGEGVGERGTEREREREGVRERERYNALRTTERNGNKLNIEREGEGGGDCRKV